MASGTTADEIIKTKLTQFIFIFFTNYCDKSTNPLPLHTLIHRNARYPFNLHKLSFNIQIDKCVYNHYPSSPAAWYARQHN